MNRPAPNFSLLDQHGQIKQLSDYTGRWLVLYFYPRDNTPNCTTEACNFRDERETIAELGKAEVVGVSTDSVRRHANFARKHNLNFALLSDPDHHVIAAYDSWGPKKMMGREFFGTHRNTFIINPEGQIVAEYKGVNPRNHATEIIRDLATLQAA